jgi:anti-sigma-K factor RskA
MVDNHLASCTACRNELDQHRNTLALLATPEEPPPELWDRIARQTASESPPRGGWGPSPGPGPLPGPGPGTPGSGGLRAQVVTLDRPRDLAPAADEWVPRHRARSGWGRRGGSSWLAAVAAVAVVLAGIAGLTVWSRGGSDDPATVPEMAAAAAEDPDATVVSLAAAPDAETSARVVTTGDTTGYVILDNLARLPEGHSYQLWRVDDPNVPISLGVLGDGSAEAAAIAVPEGTTSFAISHEAVPGGMPAPTGPIVAQGSSA